LSVIGQKENNMPNWFEWRKEQEKALSREQEAKALEQMLEAQYKAIVEQHTNSWHSTWGRPVAGEHTVSKLSFAEFKSNADMLYRTHMTQVVAAMLNEDLDEEQKNQRIGEIVADLFNNMLALDRLQGEKELSRYDSK
jgi:hypothetical protein